MKYVDRNKNINRGYRKLEVWQESVQLFRIVKKEIDSLNNISFKLKAQVEDSMFSVSSNIAEGYCRRFIKENIQFNSIALASLGENYSQIYTLFNAEIINEEWFNNYDKRHYSLENKLINYNKSIIQKAKQKEGWSNDYIIKEPNKSHGK
jgi:four helix bundle protein